MTPMQKLKPQFEEFKELLGVSFNEINLNKSDYKVDYSGFCGERQEHVNKGVKSDFIRLYRLQLNKENTYTFAFSYEYMNMQEDKHTIVFSYSVGKDEKNFSPKLEMSIEECRQHLKNINDILKIMANSSNEEIMKILREEFLGIDYQIKPQSKKKKIK